MSLFVTLLILFSAAMSTILVLRSFDGLDAESGFWGGLLGFVAGVAVAFTVNFSDPNDSVALLSGLTAAFVAAPIFVAAGSLVRRALSRHRSRR